MSIPGVRIRGGGLEVRVQLGNNRRHGFRLGLSQDAKRAEVEARLSLLRRTSKALRARGWNDKIVPLLTPIAAATNRQEETAARREVEKILDSAPPPPPEPPPNLKPRAGVYIIACDRRIKIGYSIELDRRLEKLATSLPQPFEVVALIATDDCREIERQLHRELDPWRAHGEWFEFGLDFTPLMLAVWRLVRTKGAVIQLEK